MVARSGRGGMGRERYPDEVDERDERDDGDEPDEEEAEESKAAAAETGPQPSWVQWLQIAASLAAVTAISVLTLEMALGTVRLGRFVAYALSASMLIGVLLLLIILIRRLLPKFKPGLWRYVFMSFAIPLGFFYYMVFVWLFFVQFAQLMIRIMTAAMARFP